MGEVSLNICVCVCAHVCLCDRETETHAVQYVNRNNEAFECPVDVNTCEVNM